MFLTRRPSPLEIQRFIEASRGLSPSYDPVGLANQHPDGFAVDEQIAVVGKGLEAFERAKAALADWRHFALGWVEVFLEELSPRQQRLILREMFRLVPRSRRAAPQFTGAGRVMAQTPADWREATRVGRRALAVVKRREQAALKGAAR